MIGKTLKLKYRSYAIAPPTLDDNEGLEMRALDNTWTPDKPVPPPQIQIDGQTYNLYDSYWDAKRRKTYEDQLTLLRQMNPSVKLEDWVLKDGWFIHQPTGSRVFASDALREPRALEKVLYKYTPAIPL